MTRWKKCRYCRGTRMIPKLVYPDGTPDKRGIIQPCVDCVGGFETREHPSGYPQPK